ncbi:MAG: alpha/beta hydrolase, partial [Firmicutes bacterium]|nr:alpha/beta hydrolase [Bacillota bacterium]
VSIDSCPLSKKYYTRWELAFLKHTKGMYMSIPWKLLLKWGIWGTSTTKYGRNIMEKTWSVYSKREFCELADHGYRILAKAVKSKDAYPISCPVLLLCGEKDAAGSAKRYNKEWTKQEGHPLIWLKGAGHNSNTDVPDMVNHHIEDFIKSL